MPSLQASPAAATPVGANRRELLQLADTLAREKGIEPQLVLDAIAEALEKAARQRYGSENQIRAEIDAKTGQISMARLREVVEEVETPTTQISLKQALKHNPAARLGDMIAEALPPMEFGRLAAMSARQVIIQKVNEAERERQYLEYRDKVGEIANGIVRRTEYGNVVVDLGTAEAMLRRDETIPREHFRVGDRVRAYIVDVRQESRGSQIFLSRCHNEFLAKLFTLEVPEIYDGIIEIKAIARDPGSRAKIAVSSEDSSIDPVGACVGMRGSRVQAVVNELQGEKIDIIRWSPDPVDLIVKALTPAQVSKIILDDETHQVEAVVPDEELSLAIGRRGQTVRLAAQLSGWSIDILTESEESQRRQKIFAERSQIFVDALGIEETTAQLLAAEGFASIEEIAFVDPEELLQISELGEELAQSVQENAKNYLAKQDAEYEANRLEAGVKEELATLEETSPRMLAALGAHKILTLEDLAGLTPDDLLGWQENKDSPREEGIFEGMGIGKQVAEDLILTARRAAGWIEEAPEEISEETGEEEISEETGEEAADEASETPDTPIDEETTGEAADAGEADA